MTTLLVASGGGHLQQLHSLLPRLGLRDDVVWATPHTGLSQDVLRGSRHIAIPYSAPRDWRAALSLSSLARRIVAEVGATRIVSTGASPAPPFFLVGARRGLDLHYIESATRSRGPSLSGRLVAKLPSAHLYTQYPAWADERWRFAGSIFDAYEPVSMPATTPLRRVVVTLGTEAYGFQRAVRRLLEVLPPEAEVLWQTGHTDVSALGIQGHRSIPGDQLRMAMARADLVVSHAGTGSALTCFDLGKGPLILPREARHHEHVDDHQSLTATELNRRGLAVAVPVDELTPGHLDRARAITVLRDAVERPFMLASAPETVHSRIIDLRVPRARTANPRTPQPGVIDLRDPRPASRPAPGEAQPSSAAPDTDVIDLRDSARNRSATPLAG